MNNTMRDIKQNINEAPGSLHYRGNYRDGIKVGSGAKNLMLV